MVDVGIFFFYFHDFLFSFIKILLSIFRAGWHHC